METYHKIQTLFKRDLDGSITGQKGKMIEGQWTTPELEYLAGNEWEFTEKVDGTNIRIEIHRTHEGLFINFGGRTDNALIPIPLMSRLQELFPNWPTKAMPDGRAKVVHDWMVEKDIEHVLLFGEGYGPKIQNGGNYGDRQDFVLFDVKVGHWWLTRDAVNDVAKQLGLDSVPVLGYGTLYQGINFVKYGTPYHDDEIRSIRSVSDTDWLSDLRTMRSRWGDFEAEGIVARPRVPMFDRKGERIITKIKAVDFR